MQGLSQSQVRQYLDKDTQINDLLHRMYQAEQLVKEWVRSAHEPQTKQCQCNENWQWQDT